MKYEKFSIFLESNLYFTTIYKTLLWLSIGLTIQILYQSSDGDGGAYLRIAVETGNKGRYWNIIGSFALIFFITGLWFKHIALKLSKYHRLNGKIVFCGSVIEQISIDILYSALCISSALLGTSLFFVFRPELYDLLPLPEILLAISSPVLLTYLILLISSMIILLRITPHGNLLILAQKIPLILVVLLYPALCYGYLHFFWYFKP